MKPVKQGSKEWKRRAKKLLHAEQENPLKWHYCSFATDERGFLGALFIEGHGVVDIMVRAHAMGINPGGQLYCVELPDDAPMPEEKYRNRLLSKEELIEAVGPIVKADGTPVQ